MVSRGPRGAICRDHKKVNTFSRRAWSFLGTLSSKFGNWGGGGEGERGERGAYTVLTDMSSSTCQGLYKYMSWPKYRHIHGIYRSCYVGHAIM